MERPNNSATKCGTEPAAGLPKFASLRLALHQVMNSPSVFTLAGTMGPTAKPKSNRTAWDTGWKSATGS